MRLEGGQRSEGFLLLLLFCLTCVVREEKGNIEFQKRMKKHFQHLMASKRDLLRPDKNQVLGHQIPMP